MATKPVCPACRQDPCRCPADRADEMLTELEALLGRIHHEHPRTEALKIISKHLARQPAAPPVPEGCVRTPDGVDRKVLGTLPVTADGCVAGDGMTAYCPNGHENH